LIKLLETISSTENKLYSRSFEIIDRKDNLSSTRKHLLT
jgi:hypothetical protein